MITHQLLYKYELTFILRESQNHLQRQYIPSYLASNNILIDAERAILIDIHNAYIYKISDGLSLAGIYSALSREKNTVDMHTLEKP